MNQQETSLDLSIVIVNHNTRQLLLDLLESIFSPPTDISFEVIVVDNESTDGSGDAVREAYPNVRVLENRVGRYFSGGNNQGIEMAEGQLVLVLNPDMRVLGDTLSKLVHEMIDHPEYGAATTTMFFPDMTLQNNCCREVTFSYLLFEYTFIGKLFSGRLRELREWLWYTDWDRLSPREVGVLPGSCIIAPKIIWEAAGGFDERMPMYFSDNYLTSAIARLGKKTMYLVSDGVIHYEGSITQKERTLSVRYLNMYFSDLLTYVRVVFGRPAQIMYLLLLLPTWGVQLWKAR